MTSQATEQQRLTKEWPAVRLVHLFGGLRATSGPDRTVVIEPDTIDGKIASFEIAAFQRLYSALRSLSLGIVGAEFLCDRSDDDGSKPPDWRVYHDFNATTWPSAEQADHWSFLAQGAFQAGKGELWDICSRVSFQLRVCAWRIREASELYRRQLSARVASGKLKELRFQDGFTWLGYLAVQAYLVDACVLRDYLAEFYWHVLHEKGVVKEPERIRQMSALKKHYLDKCSGNPSEAYLRSAVAKEGWLQELGAYRDVVVHVAPLAKAAGGLFAVMTSTSLSEGRKIPSVRLPLPPDPKKINDRRASGAHFADADMKFARFTSAVEGSAPTVDCLEYSHRTFGQLTYLAWDLAKNAPVQPTVPNFSGLVTKISRGRPDANQESGEQS